MASSGNVFGAPRRRAVADDPTAAMMGVDQQWYRPADQQPGYGQPLGFTTPASGPINWVTAPGAPVPAPWPMAPATLPQQQGGTSVANNAYNPYGFRPGQPLRDPNPPSTVPGNPNYPTPSPGQGGFVDPPYSNYPTASSVPSGGNPSGSGTTPPASVGGAAGTATGIQPSAGAAGAYNQRSFTDPNYFDQGYANAINNIGLGSVIGNPAASLAQNDSARAYSNYLTGVLNGGVASDTSPSILGFVNGGGLGSMGAGAFQHALQALRSALTSAQQPGATLDPTNPVQNILAMFEGSPNQALNYVLGSAGPMPGARYMRNLLDQAVQMRQGTAGPGGGSRSFTDALLSVLGY